MTERHKITVTYDVIWTAGPGRQAYAIAGGRPDALIDNQTRIPTGWSCTCGQSGPDQASIGSHIEDLKASVRAGAAVPDVEYEIVTRDP